MPGWRALDDILKEVRQQVEAPAAAPPPTDLERLRAGVMNLFEPVIDVLQKLSDSGVMIGYGDGVRRLFDADSLRQNLRSMPNPTVVLNLDLHTSLSIRIAIRPDLPYPDNITTSKWRCIISTGGTEVENRLYDNRDELARWMLTKILSFSRRPAGSVLLSHRPDRSPADPAPPAQTREHRVIMVDDPEE